MVKHGAPDGGDAPHPVLVRGYQFSCLEKGGECEPIRAKSEESRLALWRRTQCPKAQIPLISQSQGKNGG